MPDKITTSLNLPSPPKGITIKNSSDSFIVESKVFSWNWHIFKNLGYNIGQSSLLGLFIILCYYFMCVIENDWAVFIITILSIGIPILSYILSQWQRSLFLLFGKLTLEIAQEILIFHQGFLSKEVIVINSQRDIEHIIIDEVEKHEYGLRLLLSYNKELLVIGKAVPLERLEYLLSLIKKVQQHRLSLPINSPALLVDDLSQHLVEE